MYIRDSKESLTFCLTLVGRLALLVFVVVIVAHLLNTKNSPINKVSKELSVSM